MGLLHQFPNKVLADIVDVLKKSSSWTPFPAQRAKEAHKLRPSGDFTAHAPEIAREILWWGSHEFWRQFGSMPTWRDVVADVAAAMDVHKSDRSKNKACWQIEHACVLKAMAAWEELSPDKREELIKAQPGSIDALRGAGAAGAAAIARLAAPELLKLAVARLGAAAFAGPFAGLLISAMTVWSVLDLAGPGYRVLKPVTLIIALTRRNLIDQRRAGGLGV